jgi:PBP1b-binding outer membrane lipoprotein LpoB
MKRIIALLAVAFLLQGCIPLVVLELVHLRESDKAI